MKKLKNNLPALLFLLLTTIFCGCKKEHEHSESVPDVNITISAPVEAHEYDKGDTVFMDIKITSSTELHGYEIHLTRIADTAIVYTLDKDEHLSAFDLHLLWINDGKIHSEMELEVKAVYDHEGNSKSKKVNFHCHDN